jgi:hypothetical protein
VNRPATYASAYTKVSFNSTSDELNHQKFKVGGDVKVGMRWGFFHFGVSGGASHETTDLTTVFDNFQMEANIIVGAFNYPWLDYNLFDLNNISLPGLSKGSYSNGQEFLSGLEGSFAMIPQQFVIAKDMKFTYTGRKSREIT